MTDWIMHNGGPCPVPPETIVTVLFHNGTETREFPASVWQWNRDVKAYRIVSPPPPASPVKMVPKIVPGTYGRVAVFWAEGPIGHAVGFTDDNGDTRGGVQILTASELTYAIATLTAIRDAMEAGE